MFEDLSGECAASKKHSTEQRQAVCGRGRTDRPASFKGPLTFALTPTSARAMGLQATLPVGASLFSADREWACCSGQDIARAVRIV